MSDTDVQVGTEEAALSEVAVEEIAAGDQRTGAGGEDNSAVEAEARDMGWKPKDEYKGDPEKWRPADEFVNRGKDILPIVNARLKKAQDELAAERKETADKIARIERMNDQALKRQRENLTAEFEARKREAVKLGDEEGYDAAEKAQRAALKELDDQSAEPEKAKDGALSPTEMSSFSEWKTDNKWFGSDKKLTLLMDAEFAEVGDEMPAATFAKRLEEARKRVAAIYPDKFGETAPAKRAGTVEGGSRIPGGGQKGKLADKLPDDAKRAADKFVEQGLFKDREEYAKSYFENEAAQ